MKTLLYLFPLFVLFQNDLQNTSHPGNSHYKVNKSFFRIGDQLITLEKYGDFKSQDYLVVSLHHDASASTAAFSMVQSHETGFIRLVNNKGRNIEADLFNKKLVFDPNNIFTSWGRRAHLKLNQCWNKASEIYVQQFARFVLDEIPDHKTVVMFLEETYTINDFLVQGFLEKEARQVYRNEEMDASVLFLTPDENIFSKLQEMKYNVVLQHSKKIIDDGSLVVYCAKANRSYLSVVTGNTPGKHDELLTVVNKIFQ